jgi:hypothetical protein
MGELKDRCSNSSHMQSSWHLEIIVKQQNAKSLELNLHASSHQPIWSYRAIVALPLPNLNQGHSSQSKGKKLCSKKMSLF